MKKQSDYSGLIVHKPWGFEYLFYVNDYVAVWCLHISEGCETSLHCHPNKKTGLIVLRGRGKLSFLNDTIDVLPQSRQILRPGLFHSTRAIGGKLIMLEVETPPVKEDIVRFDDKYGREDKPIEDVSKTSPLDDKYPVLEKGETFAYGYKFKQEEYITASASAIIAVVSGGVAVDGDLIVTPGDVGSMQSLIRLIERFGRQDYIGLMTCVPLH